MKKNINSCVILLLCALSFTIYSCKKLTAYDLPGDGSIYQKLSADDFSFSIIKSLVDKTDMATELKKGSYTFFAPTNAAFYAAGFSGSSLSNMSTDSLIILVKSHIVTGAINVASLNDGEQLTTLSGSKIVVWKIGEDVYVDGGDITNPDESATNGVVQVINKVLMSRSSIYERIASYNASSTTYTFGFLLAALDRASEGSENLKQLLSDPNSAYTFFAPIDGAFKEAGYANIAAVEAEDPDTLAALLDNQLVKGTVFTTDFDTTNTAPLHSVNDSIMIYGDRQKRSNHYTYFMADGISVSGGYGNMMAGKGVVHCVPRFFSAPLSSNTLQFIEADTTLSFFLAAIQQATPEDGLDFKKMVSDPGLSYTVFAVTNNGFRAAGYQTIDAVKASDPAALAEMLKYHFAEKRQNNINYPNSSTMPTLLLDQTVSPPSPLGIQMYISAGQGFQVKGDLNDDTYTVISGNNVTTNGLVNVIGGILLP